MTFERDVIGLVVALGIGLLVGCERERRKGEGAARGAAGIRTFVMAALLGAISAELGTDCLLAVATAGALVLAVVGYVHGDRRDPGLTTEFALVLTVPLGALAMREPMLAAAIGVIVAIVLAARAPLHHFVIRVLTESELHSALTFAAATLVVLPVLPDTATGPFNAINLQTLWMVVVVLMAISSAGYVAVRALGAGIGLPLTGLTSGFISSAATIAAMGTRARETPSALGPAVAGAVLSTIATIVQLALLLGVTSRPTLAAMAIPLLAAGLAAVLYAGVFVRGVIGAPADDRLQPGDAFDLVAAVKLAGLFAIVLIASAALTAWYGNAGMLIAAGVAGLADAHAPAVSIAGRVASDKLAAIDAIRPVLIALTANTITKAVLAQASGGGAFARRVVPGLAFVIGAAWLGAAIGRPGE